MSRARLRRFERLADVRRFEEDRKRQELGLALRAEQGAEERVSERRVLLLETQQEFRNLLKKKALSPEQFLEMNARLRFREEAVELGSAELERHKQARLAVEAAFHEARARTRSLEKWIERQEAEVEAQERRVEQKATDEVALFRFLARETCEDPEADATGAAAVPSDPEVVRP